MHWLEQNLSTMQVFVANKVANVHEMAADGLWLHVPTKENPTAS